ncbi:Sec-independent protein translocase subunit TatA [Streptomyces sp. NPDC004735]|uniref:Sec-independent protein translocase subunit TatA n=1 Tax=Streptomyces sp. NPDC004735 TaxID=3156654 RepID=UPI0033BE4F7C
MLRNGLEPWHLLILAIVVIMLFGSKKLPDSARALGQSLRILKSETKAMKEDGATAGPAATEPLTPQPAQSASGDTPPARSSGPESGARPR